jgi:hypothetical protein
MNSQAGKGDKIRQGANLKAYWDNYDNIFRREKKNDEVGVLFLSDDKGNIYKWPDDFMMDSVNDYMKIHNLKIVHPKK